jgi:hypothetical protein
MFASNACPWKRSTEHEKRMRVRGCNLKITTKKQTSWHLALALEMEKHHTISNAALNAYVYGSFIDIVDFFWIAKF